MDNPRGNYTDGAGFGGGFEDYEPDEDLIAPVAPPSPVGPSSLYFELYFETDLEDIAEANAAYQAVALGILRAFNERAIEFAYPTQTTLPPPTARWSCPTLLSSTPHKEGQTQHKFRLEHG